MNLQICFCTTPNHETSERLAQHWVQKKWAACVNIIPKIKSIYAYQGKIENHSESLMIIKTTKAGADEIKKNLDKDHPYDCPEWVTLTADDASKNYLSWLTDNSL